MDGRTGVRNAAHYRKASEQPMKLHAQATRSRRPTLRERDASHVRRVAIRRMRMRTLITQQRPLIGRIASAGPTHSTCSAAARHIVRDREPEACNECTTKGALAARRRRDHEQLPSAALAQIVLAFKELDALGRLHADAAQGRVTRAGLGAGELLSRLERVVHLVQLMRAASQPLSKA